MVASLCFGHTEAVCYHPIAGIYIHLIFEPDFFVIEIIYDDRLSFSERP